MARKRRDGQLAKSYEFQEYPKHIRVSKGTPAVSRTAETVDKRTLTWTENVEVFDTITVHSEEEEERVTQGGKTSVDLEQDRLDLIGRCRSLGIKVDVAWSVVRLKRELGDKLDAPEPVDRVAALRAELAQLQELERLRTEIARLRGAAALVPPVPLPNVLLPEGAYEGAPAARRGDVRPPAAPAAPARAATRETAA